MSTEAMYLALGLEPGAPSADIKRAYRNLSLKLHPDASKDPLTAYRFARVAKAYETLSVKSVESQPTARDLPRMATDARGTSDVLETSDVFDLGVELSTGADAARRAKAAERLGLTGKRSAWVFLRKGLYDADQSVVRASVRAAAVLGLAQGAGEIAGAYERAGPELRDSMLDMAGATRDGLFSAVIEAAQYDSDPRRRAKARALRQAAASPER